MAHFVHGLHRFRVQNQKLCAIIAILLISCPEGKGTALIVLVSGNALVFGADGKGVDTRTNNMSPIGTRTEEKIVILQDRLMVSEIGLGRIEVPSRTKVKVLYDFTSWVKSLPIRNDASIFDVARLISEKCWPIFHDEWALLHPVRPLNLSNDPSLPLVGYYVGGSEFLGPKVYFVGIYPDWKKRILRRPTIKQVYPSTEKLARRNTFATFNGEKGGGMDQLTTDKSAVQRQYLRLYDREVGGLIYDEPLDVTSLADLGRVMLSLEIQTTPTKFSFPTTLCSSVPNQRPTCQTYDH
jgi:hypothetical protein